MYCIIIMYYRNYYCIIEILSLLPLTSQNHYDGEIKIRLLRNPWRLCLPDDGEASRLTRAGVPAGGVMRTSGAHLVIRTHPKLHAQKKM